MLTCGYDATLKKPPDGELMESFFPPYIVSLLTQIPLFIIYVVGVAIALGQRKLHPRASLYTILAMGGLLFTSLVLVAVQVWLPQYLASQAYSAVNFRLILGIISVIRNLIDAIAIGLLLLAVYNGRVSGTA
jgi:hypothetical protein